MGAMDVSPMVRSVRRNGTARFTPAVVLLVPSSPYLLASK